jgi:hypothetical protein
VGGAYDELQTTGRVGDRALALMRRLARQVTSGSSFPPPEGYSTWTPDALDELLASMFETKGGEVVERCFLEATDESSFERILLATIRNVLIDQAKATTTGKLRRRLDRLLDDDPRFAKVPIGEPGAGSWHMRGGPVTPWQGDPATLDQAAAAVRGVSITQWNTSGPTPKVVKDALLKVAEGVLRFAAGSVAITVLTRAVERRFALITPLVVGSMQDEDHADTAVAEADAPGADLIVRELAQEIYGVLNGTERALLPHLGKPLGEQMQVLELGRAQTRLAGERLAEKLRLMTANDDEREDVVLELLRLCVVQP